MECAASQFPFAACHIAFSAGVSPSGGTSSANVARNSSTVMCRLGGDFYMRGSRTGSSSPRICSISTEIPCKPPKKLTWISTKATVPRLLSHKARRTEMRAITGVLLLTTLILMPSGAFAQAESDSNLFLDITKAVVLDPTTYAPAALAYTSMKMDWDSSQTLFSHGWVEQNQRFTVSGRANDLPISFTDGNKKIRNMALLHLQESIINNTAANLFDR